MSLPSAVRGVWSQLRGGRFDLLSYKAWLRLHRLDVSFVDTDVLQTGPLANYYSDSGGPDLVRVLRVTPIPNGSRFIDVGSGKGGALFTAVRFPFPEVLGIELSPTLVSIADTNAKRIRARVTS